MVIVAADWMLSAWSDVARDLMTGLTEGVAASAVMAALSVSAAKSQKTIILVSFVKCADGRHGSDDEIRDGVSSLIDEC